VEQSPILKGAIFVNITFYNYAGDNKQVGKALSGGTALTGALRDPSNIINPSILIELNNVDNINYAYIPSFQRYYFVTEKECVRNGLFRINMHVDVLNTYNSEIRGLQAIAVRSQQNAKQSPYIIDGRQKMQAYKKVQTVSLGSLTMSSLYLLVTAG
jgi:hypothetical protein